MSLTKKIWHDENSEPPKNYLWAKGGKLFKNIEGQWKEVSKKDSENVSIDDVVKFVLQTSSAEPLFNTYEEIPDLKDIDVSTFTDGVYKGTAEEAKSFSSANDHFDVSPMLSTSSCGIYNVSLRPRYIPFTVEAIESGSIIWSSLEENTVQYSKNGGNWTTMNNETSIDVDAGDTVQFKGTNSTYIGLYTDGGTTGFKPTGKFNVKGNIMSIIAGDNFATADTVVPHAFRNFFGGYNETLISAEHLCLPATNLAEACYLMMFSFSKKLIAAPELPATVMAPSCYQEMFDGCESLLNLPKLPATTLANSCYNAMFRQCVSCVTADIELPATTLAQNCYAEMFRYCYALTKVPDLPATTLESGCYRRMFNNDSSLVNAPIISATTVAQSCCDSMFENCPITTIELLAETLAPYCYTYMFYGCSSLNNIKCLATNISANGCLTSWVFNVSSSGTFTKASSINNWPSGNNGIPTGWTIEVAS